ncbi:MAG: D-alanine--D-alanine ligase A, partial [Anaerovorax sp.]
MMLKIGIIFGGKSGEHEISLMSATSIIHAIDQEKYEVVKIGITKEGTWLLYDGPTEGLEDGSWQAYAEKCLQEDPEKYKLEILAAGGRSLKDSIDFAFPVLHGPNGEDGTIQGLFEMVHIPYAGCGVLASSTAMDKCIAKELFAKAGLPICKYLNLQREEIEEDLCGVITKIEETL